MTRSDKKAKKIVHIVGARPNFMKLAPLWRAISADKELSQVVVHTGQHYTPIMSDTVFRDLDLPLPDVNLQVESGNYLDQMAMIIERLVSVLPKIKPDLVLVYGDVNSTLAGALAAKRLGFPLAHVEAGLRSRDLEMPEERNRVLTDHIADYHLITSIDAKENLIAEGVSPKKIFMIGNLMVDSLYYAREKLAHSKPGEVAGGLIATKENFALLTLHRPGNVDKKEQLVQLFDTLKEVSKKIPVVFPVHPRTTAVMKKFGVKGFGVPFRGTLGRSGIYLLPPLSYLDFMSLYQSAKFVLTDSGGVQEETSVLGVPCLTLRENTERPVTVTHGTSTIVGSSRKAILGGVRAIMNGTYKKKRTIPFWDGHTGERAVKTIKGILGVRK